MIVHFWGTRGSLPVAVNPDQIRAKLLLAIEGAVARGLTQREQIQHYILCQMARAKRLCLFHHEPAYDDVRISRVLQETRRFEEITREQQMVDIVSAHDGLSLTL